MQSDRLPSPFLGRPYLLQPSPGTRCRVCSDIASLDGLYSRLATLCTISCWAHADHAAAAAAHPWVLSLLEVGCSAQPEQLLDLFCTTCREAFLYGDCHCDDHHHHLLPLVFHSRMGLCVQISRGHWLWSVWESIADAELAADILHSSATSTRLIPIRGRTAQRCRWCQKRLLDGGGTTCSLRCRLSLPTLLPRALRVWHGLASYGMAWPLPPLPCLSFRKLIDASEIQRSVYFGLAMCASTFDSEQSPLILPRMNSFCCVYFVMFFCP